MATAVNNDTSSVPHFDNLLDGGVTGYISNMPDTVFGDSASLDAFRSTAVISNVVNNFSTQIYQAASGGSTTVSLGNNRIADLTTSAGSYMTQTYFLALKTSAQTTALIVSTQEKIQETVIDALA